MTRLTLTIAVLFTMLTSYAVADFSQIEVETNLESSESISLLHCWGTGTITGSTYAQQYTDGSYGQLLVGADYHVLPNLTVGALIGADTGGFRYASSLFANRGRLNLALIHKGGKSGSWHKDVASYQLDDRLSLGYIDQTYCGRGATANVRIDGKTAVNYSLFEGGSQLLSVARSF